MSMRLASAEEIRDDDLLYSFLVTWNTAGSHDLLAKKATAVKRLETAKGSTISFGNLLGNTRVVKEDGGVLFLRTAARSGIDYVIPAAGDFMFGVAAFRMLSALPDMPNFISANIVDERSRKPIVRPYAMRTVSGLRTCIVGMSDPDIIRQSADAGITGIDVISCEEAMDSISADIRRERPDIVIIAGRLDRESVMAIARKYRFVDLFLTNYGDGGFVAGGSATRTVMIADRPVYIASEAPGNVGYLTVRHVDGYETREFADVTLGDDFPPDDEIIETLNEAIRDIQRRDLEERHVVKAGQEVTSLLRKHYDVDVAVIERDCLFYFPVEDSLTLLDTRKIIKPGVSLTRITLPGSVLKNIREKSAKRPDPALRLHFDGITDDGKIDDLPIQDDGLYTVITTSFLRKGGNDYVEFRDGISELDVTRDLLDVVEDVLVEKDIMIRLAEKKKIWALALNLSLGSNFNKIDVDRDKSLYGSAPPKEYRDMKDQFTGFFEVSSWDDRLNINIKRHLIESRLRARYMRSGFRTDEGHISYKEGRDDLQLFNKYTYDLHGFKLKPFAAIDVYSEFYSAVGKHPISASARTGLSREYPRLMGMVVEVGLDGTRNYVNNENSFGTTNKVMLSKSFPAKGIFTTPMNVSIDAQMTWNPMARYHMAFFMRNNNRVEFQLWRKFNLTFHVKSYTYRDSRHRKTSMGFIYDFTLNYKMDWKF